jgi:hypothetical protein
MTNAPRLPGDACPQPQAAGLGACAKPQLQAADQAEFAPARRLAVYRNNVVVSLVDAAFAAAADDAAAHDAAFDLGRALALLAPGAGAVG